MTHRETAAAFQAEMGTGEIQSEQFHSRVLLRGKSNATDLPTMTASIFAGSAFYITVQSADGELTKAIWRLVEAARAKGESDG